MRLTDRFGIGFGREIMRESNRINIGIILQLDTGIPELALCPVVPTSFDPPKHHAMIVIHPNHSSWAFLFLKNPLNPALLGVLS